MAKFKFQTLISSVIVVAGISMWLLSVLAGLPGVCPIHGVRQRPGQSLFPEYGGFPLCFLRVILTNFLLVVGPSNAIPCLFKPVTLQICIWVIASHIALIGAWPLIKKRCKNRIFTVPLPSSKCIFPITPPTPSSVCLLFISLHCLQVILFRVCSFSLWCSRNHTTVTRSKLLSLCLKGWAWYCNIALVWICPRICDSNKISPPLLLPGLLRIEYVL